MTTLWQQFQQLKADNAYLFQYDAAKILGVSEGDLLITAPDVLYLGQDYLAILARLTAIQEVQLMVRNDHAVHEKNTKIQPLKNSPHVVMAIEVGGYDVRMFPKHWQHVIAYDFQSRGSLMRSIQFYDAVGNALQKIYLKSDDDAVWQAIVDDFKQPQLPQFSALPEKTQPSSVQLNTDDQLTFQNRWKEMSNIHQFFGLLNDYRMNRLQAFEHAPKGYAFKVDTAVVETMYRIAAEKEVPLINFVGNDGVIQIQTGTVKNISRLQGWLNIFDGKHNGFTLHLDDTGIASTWLVLRPTKDGIVSCLECLDQNGQTIISIFGQRLEGQPELDTWREVLAMSTGHTIANEIAA